MGILKRQIVFCKDCKFHTFLTERYSIYQCSARVKTGIDFVLGREYQTNYEDCYWKNANGHCRDYKPEPQEVRE